MIELYELFFEAKVILCVNFKCALSSLCQNCAQNALPLPYEGILLI